MHWQPDVSTLLSATPLSNLPDLKTDLHHPRGTTLPEETCSGGGLFEGSAGSFQASLPVVTPGL